MLCENLNVWKRSAALSAEIYLYFRDFNDFGFKDQITRSSLSIPSNISEGVERSTAKETIRFLNIAEGSCAELITQIYIGMKIEYIDSTTGSKWIKELQELHRMLGALKKSQKPDN
ncbi:four helix bundle protein [Nitratifractor sp.]